ncbi:hypothetical protein [Microvirga sp. VF16]|uniref:hypothetical protein n=1 Tax=Microvirga sp. VF16 TaxID=2807101 RepID=UPI00193EC0C8|nr:hypothetical protein [Microvirga sp. VF16]QRM35225.1 hypothetical protein JO965_40315 [Microvirga sp. VF16]
MDSVEHRHQIELLNELIAKLLDAEQPLLLKGQDERFPTGEDHLGHQTKRTQL